MSDLMHSPVPRAPRAERTTTSCGECRRRKQKCNQGQPCSNCARRFPQPVCEYKTSNRRPSGAAVPQRPAFAISLSPPAPSRNEAFNIDPLRHPPIPQHSPLLSPWPQQQSSQDVGDIFSNWPGFGFLGQPASPSSPGGEYSWSTDQQRLSMCIVACEEGCTSHSGEVHDAIRTLHAYRSTRSQWANNSWVAGDSAWTLVPTVPVDPAGIPWPVPGESQDYVQIPVTQPMQNSDLLSVFIKFLSQFTASLDGKPDAQNPYIKYYVPYCINSQLLVQAAIYSAACFLTDTGHVKRTVAMAHRGHVIKLLNEHIQAQRSNPTDEVIAGVVQLIVDEWLWGSVAGLKAHLHGLRELIRTRGGFRTLGLHGLIGKLAITTDVAIALSFEVPPFLRGGSEFEFHDNSQHPLRVSLNTPFISTPVAFSSCADALRIHPAVAAILDDMRFLLAAVLALPEKPSAKELQKVHTTSAWIHERIAGLPAESPTSQRLSGAGLTPGRAASGTPELGEDQPGCGPSRSHQNPRRASVQPQDSPHPQQQHDPPSAVLPNPTPTTAVSEHQPPPDYVYQAIRLAALLYSRAIMHRQPFSAIVNPAEFLRLWTTAWRVPLSKWRSLLGVFNWILLPIVPSGKAAQPHDRFVKGVINISLFQMGMENWEIAWEVMEGAGRLQRWLAGEGTQDGSEQGGGSKWRQGNGTPAGDVASGGESVPSREKGGRMIGEEQKRDKGEGKGIYGQVGLGC
ncbi:hypothetical protein VTI74DRAFT_9257 [Chaetomium olivicolor]